MILPSRIDSREFSVVRLPLEDKGRLFAPQARAGCLDHHPYAVNDVVIPGIANSVILKDHREDVLNIDLAKPGGMPDQELGQSLTFYEAWAVTVWIEDLQLLERRYVEIFQCVVFIARWDLFVTVEVMAVSLIVRRLSEGVIGPMPLFWLMAKRISASER